MGKDLVASNLLAIRICLLASMLPGCVSAEEEHVSKSDWCSAIMLLGSIGFMMGAFYLTNHSNDIFRMHAWGVFSATISIFSAVLLFQAINGMVIHTFVENRGMNETSVAFCHFLTWYLILQIVLAVLSGAVCKKRSNVPASHEKLLEDDAEEKDKRKTEENLKCWATMLGHIVGFAGINAWAVLQQSFEDSLLGVVVVIGVAYLAQLCLIQVTTTLRNSVALGDDGRLDHDEEEWEEETAETEDDVIGLVFSFLLVQAIRMTLTGNLPNAEGKEEANRLKSNLQVALLYLCGFCALAAQGVLLQLVAERSRWVKQQQLILTFTFSWCIYFAADWFDEAHASVHASGMIKQVYLALGMTIFGMAGIWLVERIGRTAGKRAHKTMRGVVFAMGNLIGFSWEKCFDIAVTNVSSSCDDPKLVKIALAVVLVAVVVPAWRWYILPDVLDMELALEEKEAREEEAANTAVEDEERAGQDCINMDHRMSIIGKGPEKLGRRIVALEAQLQAEQLNRRKAEERARDHLVHADALKEVLDKYADEVETLRQLASTEHENSTLLSSRRF